MSPPIYTPDGSEVAEIVAPDGSQVQEVRDPDGNVVFSAGGDIPDSGDLQAHYDFAEEDGSLPVLDRSGNGFDLDGQYSGVSGSINGNQAGEFDGSDDLIDVSFPSTVSQPTTVFIVFRVDATNKQEFFDGSIPASHLVSTDASDNFNMYAGSKLGSTDADTNPHIISAFFNGSNSILRLDGTEIASGDVGTSALDGISLGARAGGSDYADVDIGEVIAYPQDKSSIFGDVESYLADRWGITI